jgi:hypothetical protein
VSRSRTRSEYRSLGVAASETTRYRGGILQLGEAENEVVARHYVEFVFRVANVVQRLDRVEAGSTTEKIGELAMERLEAMKKIRENPRRQSRVGLRQGKENR